MGELLHTGRFRVNKFKHPIVTALIGLILGMVIISIVSDCPEPLPPPTPVSEIAFDALTREFNARYKKLQDENVALQNELSQIKTSQTQQFVELQGQHDQIKRDYNVLLARNAELLAAFNPDLVSEYSILRARLTALQNAQFKLDQENIRLKKELEDAE